MGYVNRLNVYRSVRSVIKLQRGELMRYNILKLLRERKSFVSGEEIGEIFDVSRSAVWKSISKLKSEGYIIESVTNKGYLLNDTVDILNSFEATYNINTEFIGSECFYYNEIDSTNDEAKKYAEKGCSEGAVFISELQKNGKGRLGRNWKAKKGENLLFSIVLKPQITPMEATQITLVAGISVCSALRKMTGLDAKIKWPNDIVLNGKKIVGILTEMSAAIENVKYVVVGIGINVNSENFSEEIQNKATSLYLEGKKKIKRAELLKCTLSEFEKNYKIYLENGFFEPFSEIYKQLCANIGKRIKIIYKDKIIFGMAYGISENGELLFEDDNGNKKKALSGEVSVRNENGEYV